MTLEEQIKISYRELFPTGRAWNYARGAFKETSDVNVFVDGIDDYFVDGLGNYFVDGANFTVEEKNAAYFRSKLLGVTRFVQAVSRLLDQKHPGSKYYLFEDTENWERVYGIIPPIGATEEERTQVVLQRLSYPNGYKAKGTAGFIQLQLRNAGFDVYVHENRFPLSYIEAQCGTSQCGIATCGGSVLSGEGNFENRLPESGYTEIVTNYLDPNEDIKYLDNISGLGCGDFNSQCGVAECQTATYVTEKAYHNYLFISDETYPNLADVDSNRRSELRQMILKYKPAHAVVFNYINYI